MLGAEISLPAVLHPVGGALEAALAGALLAPHVAHPFGRVQGAEFALVAAWNAERGLREAARVFAFLDEGVGHSAQHSRRVHRLTFWWAPIPFRGTRVDPRTNDIDVLKQRRPSSCLGTQVINGRCAG